MAYIVRTHQHIIQEDFSYIIPRVYPTIQRLFELVRLFPFFAFQNVVCGHILFCCCNPLGFLYIGPSLYNEILAVRRRGKLGKLYAT